MTRGRSHIERHTSGENLRADAHVPTSTPPLRCSRFAQTARTHEAPGSESAGRKKQSGFTIVELMIASTIFSIVLLLLVAVVAQIGKMYYKGIIMARTQESARAAIDEVTRPIQFGKDQIVSGANVVCVGTKRYTYALNVQLTDDPAKVGSNHRGRHGLWMDNGGSPASCTPVNMALPTPSAGGQELLGLGMRLKRFSVTASPAAAGLWNVQVGVLYGDDDMLTPDAANPQFCKVNVSGSQWCALSELSTQVSQRLL